VGEDIMKTSHPFFRMAIGTFLACLISPALRAQTQTTNSDADRSAVLLQRVDELQKQVDALRAEVAKLKEERPASAPAATATPAPPAAAAAAGAPSTAPAAPTSGETTVQASTPGPLRSLLGSTNLSGFVDTYYGYNFNQPQNRMSGLRGFDGLSNQFGLNMIELVADKTPDAANGRLGYHIALGFGQAMNVVNGTAGPNELSFAQYLKEGYFSYLAPVGKGLQLDVGKFVTPHGAEVIETKDNWNYSRGLLFTFAIPHYHFGLRAKYAFNDKYSLAAYLVNGWNNIIENNTGKTVGLTFGWNPNKKFSLVQNYMAGPETAGLNTHWRQLSDTVVTVSPTSKLSFMMNYDYGRGDLPAGFAKPVFWTGVAGYVHYVFNSKYALATRFEYYDDHDGFTTGTVQQLSELTGTFERTIAKHLITRLEFRRDMSNATPFLKGNLPVADQNTMTVGLVYTFDTRDAQ
jgi:hypothetical protein